ncbi:hypothetical protein H6F61_21025 [Cyanobacteria bacterium FACHB-472]|nr:hypothetical protein [Cyanobacteria bacterium FACHB-472]
MNSKEYKLYQIRVLPDVWYNSEKVDALSEDSRLIGYPVPDVALDLTIAKSSVDALAEFCDRPVSTYPEVICALQAVLPSGRNSNFWVPTPLLKLNSEFVFDCLYP